MSVSVSPHTEGTILSAPAELTVNTLKVKAPCFSRNAEFSESSCPYHINKDYYLDFSGNEIYIILLNFLYLCKKNPRVMNSNKQNDMWRYRSTEQQITRTNVTFAINVNVLHLAVYCI